MPLSNTKTGDAIAAYIQSVKPTPGIPVSTNALKLIWDGIMNIIYGDMKTDLTLNFDAGDIKVDPGTFKDSVSIPITGVGTSESATLTGKVT